MRWKELSEEGCPVARALSVIGDRWTLLILRDCFLGHRRFERFQQRLGITRHLLTDRLRKLEEEGVLRREPYQERPLRHEYRLTEKGKALYPTLVSLMTWANANVPAKRPPTLTLVGRDSGEPVEPLLVDARSGQPITHRTVRAVSRPTEDAAEGAAEDAAEDAKGTG